MMTKLIFFIMVALLTASHLRAEEISPQTRFHEGVVAYQKGEFVVAQEQFEKILEAGWVSGEVYYNLGNSYYRNGRLGLAIHAYLTGVQQSPRDTDLRDNLSFLRRKTADRLEPTGFAAFQDSFLSWTSWLGNSEWLITALVLNGIFWLLALLRLFRRSEFLTLSLAIGAILVAIPGSVWVTRLAFQGASGVVIEPEVSIYSAPGTESTELFRLHEGTEFRLRAEEGEWLRLKLADGKQGWVSASVVRRLH